MRLRLFLVAAFMGFIYSSPSYAGDSLRIDRKAWENLRSDRTFNGQVWNNPALVYFAEQPVFSQLAIKGFFRKEKESILLQQGNGEKGFDIRANSYLILTPKSRVWGSASYTNQKRTSVRWNESSDFEKVYPYVTADTLGGDLKSETYTFSGGYVHAVGKYTWAVTLKYKATMEYRDVDPRPKNTVSDLLFSVGGSRAINKLYRGALSFQVGKYKQDDALKFFSALGGIPIYHLTGLGMQYVRFAGTNTNVLYDGVTWGGSIDLLPDNKQGFAASLGYRYFGYDKQMGDLGDLTLCHLDEDEFRGEVSYTKNRKGIRLGAVYKKRTGTENIFGSPNGSIYPLINSAENYSNKQTAVKLAGLYGQTSSAGSWNLLPEIGYTKIDVSYLEPERFLRGQWIDTQLNWEGNRPFHRSSLTTVFSLNYRHSLNAEQQMEGQEEDDKLKELTDNAYQVLSSHVVSASALVRWDIPVRFIKEGGFFIQTDWKYDKYLNFTTAWKGSISTGIVF